MKAVTSETPAEPARLCSYAGWLWGELRDARTGIPDETMPGVVREGVSVQPPGP